MFKTGVKLPKSDEQWNLANNFFKTELPAHEIENKSLDDIQVYVPQNIRIRKKIYFSHKISRIRF